MRDFLRKIGNKDSFPRVGIFIVSSPFMTTIKELEDSFPRVGIFIVSSPFMTTIKELAFGLKMTYTQWNKDSFPRVGIFIVRK